MLTAATDNYNLNDYENITTTPGTLILLRPVKCKSYSDSTYYEYEEDWEIYTPPTATKKKRENHIQCLVNDRKPRIYRRPASDESNENHLSLGESLLRDLRSLAIQEDEQDLEVEIQSIPESVESAENRSLAESFLTQSSTGFIGSCEAAQERRLHQRQKQIDYGKNTIGYARYTTLVPFHKRGRQDPVTPDKNNKSSKRSWDGLVRNWRRKLHLWDPPDEENGCYETEETTEMGTQTCE